MVCYCINCNTSILEIIILQLHILHIFKILQVVHQIIQKLLLKGYIKHTTGFFSLTHAQHDEFPFNRTNFVLFAIRVH